MNKRTFSFARGFTLIEVLVVVAIVGILTSILVANYTEARKNSRDKIRKTELKELQLALELYKAQNNRYPAAGCSAVYPQWAGSESSYSGYSSVTACPQGYIQGIVPEYTPGLPTEIGPVKVGKGYAYAVNADGSSYKLLVHHAAEATFVASYADEFARCPRNFGSSHCGTTPENDVYAAYSAGAESW